MGVDIHLYVHQKGQLLRKLSRPDFALDNKLLVEMKLKYKRGATKEIDLRINSVEVLKKRPHAVTSCNATLHNDDRQWHYSVIKAVGCIPPFMKIFVSKSIFLDNVQFSHTCDQDQYRKLDIEYSVTNQFKKAAKLYKEPCKQMTTIVTSAVSDTGTETVENLFNFDVATLKDKEKYSLVMKLEYAAEHYKETINNKAFSLASLWSQIGGFIGMFLGYSLLHLPELTSDVIQWAKDLLNSSKTNHQGADGILALNDTQFTVTPGRQKFYRPDLTQLQVCPNALSMV